MIAINIHTYSHRSELLRINIYKGVRDLVGVIFGFFVISLLLFLGAFNYLLLSKRAGAYPPKRILIQKAMGFAAIGAGVLVVAIVLYIFSH
ncbi:hypothetical protein ACFSYB_03965 [Litchfieldia salsa]